MTIEDLLIKNIEFNKTAEESDKRPEKILRFFRLSAVKNNIENSDLIYKYNNIYEIPINILKNVLKSLNIDGEKQYTSIDELKDDTKNMETLLNYIIAKQYIPNNVFENPNSDFNVKLNKYKNYKKTGDKDSDGDNGETGIGTADNLYIISTDIINELLPLSINEINKTIINIPKDYYIYSEIDKNNILNKFNQINNE